MVLHLGTYLYFQSNGAQSNTVATLMSPTYQLSSRLCQIQFSYHMYGTNIGTLSLSLSTNTGQSSLVQYDLNEGDKWLEGTQYVGSMSNFRLNFTYLYPGGFFTNGRGNAALDDIRFIDCNPRVKANTCSQTKSNWQCVFSGECIAINSVCDGLDDCTDRSDEDPSFCSVLPAYCEFENGLCGYSQGSKDNFDWLRQTGATGSFTTGPTVDHTLGTQKGRPSLFQLCQVCIRLSNVVGSYLYIEASSPRVALDYADLYSPLMSPPPRVGGGALSCSVRFCYHMYGISIGDLTVFFENGDGRQDLWHVHGNQGDRWLCDQVALDNYIRNINYQVNTVFHALTLTE